jgi:hypothetical protein
MNDLTSTPRGLRSLLVAMACAASLPAAAAVVFADDFEDADVSDWAVSASAGVITPVVTTRTDSVHGGSHAMWVYFDAPNGGRGANTVRATHSFVAPVAGDYTIELWARSAPCGGCTMSFDVLLDGMLLTRDGGSPSAFTQETFSFTGLAAGLHQLTLGMHTNAAASGRFQASFDDVRISTTAVIPTAVPAPAGLALVLAGLGVVGAQRRSRRADSAAQASQA